MTPALELNRRRNPRAFAAFAVKHTVGNHTLLCQANDISTQGLFMACVTDHLWPHQTKGRLEFSLPGTEVTITALGRVVRQETFDRFSLTAVKFAALAPSHRRLIEKYIQDPHLTPPMVPTFLPAARLR